MISIIIVNYNNEDLLKKCLDSVRAQKKGGRGLSWSFILRMDMVIQSGLHVNLRACANKKRVYLPRQQASFREYTPRVCLLAEPEVCKEIPAQVIILSNARPHTRNSHNTYPTDSF